LAVSVLPDLATLGRRHLSRNARALERETVAPHGKAVQTAKHHRMIRNARAQKRHVRIVIRPRALVPAPTDDPLSFRNLTRARLDAINGLGLGLHADQV